jgi:hypothetical protein
MMHFSDLRREATNGLQKCGEVRTLAKPVQVSFRGAPLDPQNPGLRIFLALREFVRKTLRRHIELPCGNGMGLLKRLTACLVGHGSIGCTQPPCALLPERALVSGRRCRRRATGDH